jgi:hypothetical protein
VVRSRHEAPYERHETVVTRGPFGIARRRADLEEAIFAALAEGDAARASQLREQLVAISTTRRGGGRR